MGFGICMNKKIRIEELVKKLNTASDAYYGGKDEAISNYEEIISNNPTYFDSVFAVIDIGNTYEEAGNYKSTLGIYSQLVPQSREKHIKNTVDLLLSLKQDEAHNIINSGTSSKILNHYPNPFTESTNLQIYNSLRGQLVIRIINADGKEVYKYDLGTLEKGEFLIELSLSNFPPGIYYVVLESNSKQTDAVDMIKL